MDRRVGLVAIAALAAACGDSRSDRSGAPSSIDATVPVVTRPVRPPVDAALREVDAAPIRPGDVLSGAQAEQAISVQVSPGVDAGAPLPDAPLYRVTAEGAGPFSLGMTRADVASRVPDRAFTRVRTAAGQPSREIATVALDGAALLRISLYAARVVEIEVVRRERRAATDGAVMVGSTFEDAIDAHGEPVRIRDTSGAARGFMMSELPGVVFAPADASVLAAPLPPADATIGRIVILGAESLAPPD